MVDAFKVCYFSHEVQDFNDSVRSSSGGLGVVARDDMFGFEQLGFSALGITLWPSHGYGKQIVKNDKDMEVVYPPNPTHKREVIGYFHMELSGKRFRVNICERQDVDRVHTKLLGLDTDLEENPNDIRRITWVLYGGKHATGFAEDKWLKICQQAVLGIGGIFAMRTLGLEADLYHINECHGAFAQLFIYQEYLRQSYAPNVAREKTIRRFVYTNHTPVEAGNPVHPYDVTENALRAYIDKHTYSDISGRTDVVPMTEIAFALSRKWNGVADLHAAVIREMYKRPDILGIRNGIYVPAWQMPEFRDLKDPKDIPEIKRSYKEIVYKECLRRARECGLTANEHVSLDEFLSAYPSLMFARRWAGYKRMQMITHSKERAFVENFLRWNKMSIVWGGSPHADDVDRRADWEAMLADTRKLPNVLTFLNYDPWGMRYLKAAADVWFNFMWYGREACGTSWMSAMLNCSLNVSVLDGGVPEAAQYVVGFGSRQIGGWDEQYDYDANDLWKQLSTEVLPRFWRKDESLYGFLFDAKQWAEENLSVIPTCRRYIKELYGMELPS